MSIFDTYTQILSINNNEKIYVINSVVLNYIKQWRFNRPPDMNRVEEIKKSIQNDTYVQGIIYIAEINNEFVCYDGNHRREALKTFTGDILVNVLFNTTDKIIEERFKIINSSNPVPELYLDDPNTTNDIKLSIVNCVQRLCKNFKEFSSVSSRCKRPNFNRDTLTDYLYSICKNNNLLLSSDELYDTLMKVNNFYRTEKYKEFFKLNEKQQIKIQTYNFHLFIDGLTFENTFLRVRNTKNEKS